MKKEMAAALIIRKERVLLVHNIKHNTLRIEPPGGKKKRGETWEEAVAREVKEELGVKIKPSRLFGIYDTHSPEGDFTVHIYLADIISGEPVIAEPEKIGGFGWYRVEEIEKLKASGNLVPNMCDALEDLKKIL